MQRSMRIIPRIGSGAAALVILTSILAAPPARAVVGQKVTFASSPNPVGSGARAVGWANAFIAVADDATAASWNPGGLVQLLTPEASFALSYHNRMEDVSFSGLKTDSATSNRNGTSINYASVVYPFHVGDVNMVASLNYQQLYTFDRRLKFTSRGSLTGTSSFIQTNSLEQIGGLTTLTPAFAIQILPQWSLGVAVNFWGLDHDGGDGWEQQWQSVRTNVDPAYAGYVTKKVFSNSRESYEISGVNYVIGTHVKIQNLTLAAVYKTSFEADVDFESEMETSTVDFVNPATGGLPNSFSEKQHQRLIWPESYGFGAAYRVSDRLSFAVDAYTTRWSEYVLKKQGKSINLLTGSDSRFIQDTWQFHLGAEYLWIQPKYVFALRGGGFYDPEPFQNRVNQFYGLAIGTGVVYQNIVIDAALQYRWGNDIPGERIEDVESKTDARELFAVVSVIYHLPGR
jgi:long-subunit fatty acid transport protein